MPLLTLALRGVGIWGLGQGFVGVWALANLRRLFPSNSSAEEATPAHLGWGLVCGLWLVACGLIVRLETTC